MGSFFLCVSLVSIQVVNLPERTEMGLITGEDQSGQAVISVIAAYRRLPRLAFSANFDGP